MVAEDDRKAGYTWDEIREQLFTYFQGSDSATLVHLSAHLQKRNNAHLYISFINSSCYTRICIRVKNKTKEAFPSQFKLLCSNSYSLLDFLTTGIKKYSSSLSNNLTKIWQL